jgi:hypothetical protein
VKPHPKANKSKQKQKANKSQQKPKSESQHQKPTNQKPQKQARLADWKTKNKTKKILKEIPSLEK